MRASSSVICGFVLVQAVSLQTAAAGPAGQPPVDLTVAAAATTSANDDQNNKKPGESSKSPEKREKAAHTAASKSRLSEKPVPLLKEHKQLPERNPPIVEWNLPFLGPGNIISGFKIPTGAVWQPAFWVFGTAQTSAGVANDGYNPGREYVSGRADIFGHLQLTPTERVVIGFTPALARTQPGHRPIECRRTGHAFRQLTQPEYPNLLLRGRYSPTVSQN